MGIYIKRVDQVIAKMDKPINVNIDGEYNRIAMSYMRRW